TGLLAQHPEIRTITIVGSPVPVPNMGELGYFSEDTGYWLPVVLRQLGFNVKAHVVAHLTAGEVPDSGNAVFQWSGDWPDARLESVCRAKVGWNPVSHSGC